MKHSVSSIVNELVEKIPVESSPYNLDSIKDINKKNYDELVAFYKLHNKNINSLPT